MWLKFRFYDISLRTSGKDLTTKRAWSSSLFSKFRLSLATSITKNIKNTLKLKLRTFFQLLLKSFNKQKRLGTFLFLNSLSQENQHRISWQSTRRSEKHETLAFNQTSVYFLSKNMSSEYFLLKNIFLLINPFSFVYSDKYIFREIVLVFSFFNFSIIFQNLGITSNKNWDVNMNYVFRGF